MKIECLSNRQKAFPRLLLNLYRGRGWGKSYNYFKYDWGMLKRVELNFVPPVFVATITEACDLRCPTCLYGLQSKYYLNNNSYMKLADFKTILMDNNVSKADTIFLTGGEPLLHSEFGEFVDMCKGYGLKVKISTNGIKLGEIEVSYLKALDDINVSLDAWDSNSFKKYRGGSAIQWRKIVAGMEDIKKLGIKFSISFILTTNTIKEIMNMLEFADYIIPDTVHFHNINPHGSSDIEPLTKQCEELKYLDFIKSRVHYPYDIVVSHVFDTASKDFYTKRCVQPWYYFCFNSQGDMAPCCHIEHNNYMYGNLFSNNKRVNNHRMVCFRADMINGYGFLIDGPSCKFCHRRFLGDNYAVYSRRKRSWIK